MKQFFKDVGLGVALMVAVFVLTMVLYFALGGAHVASP